MKHIRCNKCGDLVRPVDYFDHLRNCTRNEENEVHDAKVWEDTESPSKRQKVVDKDREQSAVKEDDLSKLLCSKCGKRFCRKWHCLRHEKSCEGRKQQKTNITACKKCGKQFSDYRGRLRHEKKCFFNQKRGFTCTSCGETFMSVNDLTKHEKHSSHNKPGSSMVSTSTESGRSKDNDNNRKNSNTDSGRREMDLGTEKDNIPKQVQQPLCRLCGDRFQNYKDLYTHRMLVHKQSKSDLSRIDPWTSNNETPPWINVDGSENVRLRRVYDQHKHLILRERIVEGQVRDTYNFPVPNLSNAEQLIDHLDFIFERSPHAFKINLSFGLILQHVENDSYRYFAPHYTDGLFLFPQLISSRQDINRLRSRLTELDLSTYFQKQKPNSKWKPVLITNAMYVVHKTSFPLGFSQPLPTYITDSKSIISFAKNPNTGRPYTDNLCFFRCLAYHKIKKRQRCETLSSELHSQWLQYAAEKKLKSSDVTLCKMPDLESCFELNINVYELNDKETVTSLYKSRGIFSKENSSTMNLNMFSDHLSYISKFKSYASKFRCRLCTMMFDRKDNLDRHEKTCQNATTLRFPGGYFNPVKSIFDHLNDLGISVDQSLQSYPWFITFDMESMLKTVDDGFEGHLTKTQLHQPVSVSICSNVDSFENPEFILEEDPEMLLNKMLAHMNCISDKAYSLAKERWGEVFTRLNMLDRQWCTKDVDVENGDDDDDDDDDDADDDEVNSDDGFEAKETSHCEPPSEKFVKAISKENVFYKFLKNLETTDSFKVDYNEWDDSENSNNVRSRSNSCCSCRSNSSVYSNDSCASNSSSCSYVSGSSSNEQVRRCESTNNDGDDNDHILSFRPLNSRRIVDDDDNDDDDDDDDRDENDHILSFRPLNSKRTGDDDDDDDDDYRSFPETSKLMVKLIKRIRERFETYCHQIPVIGFNSAKYDLNLVKTKLAKLMKLHEPKQQKFVVKKNSAYTCLSNSKLRFLDMVNYLPPGTSYDKFLQTFGVTQRKSYFPYEYFTDLKVLDETSLPPKEAFYSSLKQCNVLENPARVEYEKLITLENRSQQEALAQLKLELPPLSRINETYDSLLEIWRLHGMKTFRDFLTFYNNLDTLPMVEGIEKYRLYFEKKGIDIFKDCISVPGAARLDMFKSGLQTGASFSLIDRKDEDLYHTLKANIVGGPSIVFSRYQEVGKTNIRENDNRPCSSVLGYDANALYLYCICQPMPCGNYIRRKVENGFKPIKSSNRYQVMYDWLEWLNHTQAVDIKHKMNNGREKRIGPYLVDGYDLRTKTVYEFLGCYFHGHDCIVCADKQKHTERRSRTEDRIAYIINQGFKVEIVWECDFKRQLKENDQLSDFVAKRYPLFYNNNRGKVNEAQILQAVIDETLFGFIEVDICVPKSWDDVYYRPDTELSPYEYFEEMCPLFCTTDVPYEVIGEHMQKHVDTYGLSKNPRNLLVAGMKGENLLIASPLLNWYLKHGLQVTKVHQVVEFNKLACFKNFGESITHDRRSGDIDKSQELRSSLSKLIGNSAFGGTIINQEKFQRVKYIRGFRKACFAVNNPRFRQINELGGSVFETEFANANITINSPVYLGYMILQYAKLHMLSFYYDFLDKYVSRSSFEMVEMDTDSCYFALSSESLINAIKPAKLKAFVSSLQDNCRDDFIGDNFQTVWFPRECCEKHNKFDSRTPGLMKLEFRGTKFIGLCSKSYIGINKGKEGIINVKYSLKGVNKQFCNPINIFDDVLKTGQSALSTNRGIRTFNNSVFTYIQPKQAFNYFYCKRQVLPDGIHTKPLDIVLKPNNKYKQKIQQNEVESKTFIDSILI